VNWIAYSGFFTGDCSMSPFFENADFSMKVALFRDVFGNESCLESWVLPYRIKCHVFCISPLSRG
jgi:hypothetical protein